MVISIITISVLLGVLAAAIFILNKKIKKVDSSRREGITMVSRDILSDRKYSAFLRDKIKDVMRGGFSELEDKLLHIQHSIGLVSFKTDDDNQIVNNSSFEIYIHELKEPVRKFKVSNIRQDGKRCVEMKFKDKSTEIIPEDDFYQKWYDGDITKV